MSISRACRSVCRRPSSPVRIDAAALALVPPPVFSATRRTALFVLLSTGLVLGAVATFVLVRTERYIEKVRPMTLMYRPHPFRRHVLVSNQRYEAFGVGFTINEWGFRGAMPPLPKPAGTFRFVVVGGSSVFDHHLPEEKSWPERLGPLLKPYLGGDVESFNFGVPGYSTRETLATVYGPVDRASPDAVVVYLGWNDAKYMKAFLTSPDPNRHFSYRPFWDRYRFLTEARPWRNYYAFRRILKDRFQPRGLEGRLKSSTSTPRSKAKAEPRLIDWPASPGLAFFRRNLAAIIMQLHQDGVVPLLVAQVTLVTPDLSPEDRKKVRLEHVGVSYEELLRLNTAMVAAMKDEAQQCGAQFIDLQAAFNGRTDYFRDHVHMTEEGSRAFAAELAKAIASAIKPRR